MKRRAASERFEQVLSIVIAGRVRFLERKGYCSVLSTQYAGLAAVVKFTLIDFPDKRRCERVTQVADFCLVLIISDVRRRYVVL